MSWLDEWAAIKVEAFRTGVDPYFLAAIRKTENGGPGKEFGVLAVSAPTFQDQLRVCAATVRHRLVEYNQNHPVFASYRCPNGESVLIYVQGFIGYLGSIYAPVDAGNDPNGLNLNWVRNVTWQYQHLIDAAHNGVLRDSMS